MTSRRLSPFTVAACDGGFALAIFACGYFNASMWLTGLVAAGMVGYWGWSRRAVLNRLHGRVLATQTGLALSVIIAILAGAYWLGLGVGGQI
jgi:hypothetical protein